MLASMRSVFSILMSCWRSIKLNCLVSRIAKLIGCFVGLSRRHGVVLKAKRQRSLPALLVADCRRHGKLHQQTEALFLLEKPGLRLPIVTPLRDICREGE